MQWPSDMHAPAYPTSSFWHNRLHPSGPSSLRKLRSSSGLDQGVITLWVFDVKRIGNIEEYIAEETGKGRDATNRSNRSGLTYFPSFLGRLSERADRRGVRDRVHVSSGVISPDHKDVPPIWLSRYQNLENADIVGWFVVSKTNTYYNRGNLTNYNR